jgi:hypothetical protein
MHFILLRSTWLPVPEIIDTVFAKTRPKRSFSMVFKKTRVYKFGNCSFIFKFQDRKLNKMSVVQLIRSILSLCPSEIRPKRLMPEELPHFFYPPWIL